MARCIKLHWFKLYVKHADVVEISLRVNNQMDCHCRVFFVPFGQWQNRQNQEIFADIGADIYMGGLGGAK